MTKAPKRRPGRPTLGSSGSVQLAIRFPEEMVAAVDAIAQGRMDKPDRAALIRELLAEALEARERKGKGR